MCSISSFNRPAKRGSGSKQAARQDSLGTSLSSSSKVRPRSNAGWRRGHPPAPPNSGKEPGNRREARHLRYNPCASRPPALRPPEPYRAPPAGHRWRPVHGAAGNPAGCLRTGWSWGRLNSDRFSIPWGHQVFARRGDRQALQCLDGALRGGIEAAQGIDLIAEEIQAHRLRIGGVPDIQDAAPAGKLPRRDHRADRLVAQGDPGTHQLIGLDHLPGL